MKTCEWQIDDFENCGNPCEGNTKYCGTHNRLIRKEIQRLSKPKKVYAKPKKVSDKRKVQNAEYKPLREQYLKDHPECEIKLLEVCTRISTQIHHTASGTNKATNLNNVSTWKASCDMCNQFLHDKLSAQEARNLGLKI